MVHLYDRMWKSLEKVSDNINLSFWWKKKENRYTFSTICTIETLKLIFSFTTYAILENCKVIVVLKIVIKFKKKMHVSSKIWFISHIHHSYGLQTH